MGDLMNRFWIVGILFFGCLISCQREEPEEQAEAKQRSPAPFRDSSPKSSKVTDQRRSAASSVPIASPVATMPGFVKSPFSGELVEVTGIPAGSIMVDPTVPPGEAKQFRVPEVEQPQVDPNAEIAGHEGEVEEEVVAAGAEIQEEVAHEEEEEFTPPTAAQVPGNPNFVFSPYTNQLVDVRGLYAGTIVQDPSSPPGQPRFFVVPVILGQQVHEEVHDEIVEEHFHEEEQQLPEEEWAE